uniref:Ycf34 n=1 Tax=Alaria praelonga TaxID=88159 RepID=UPI001D1013D0|nr:Ycf34 [Alaria praelonga]UAX21651.1 Ycf34 [Alaria praelonga]
MCICLNCERINNCEVYFIVEQKHNEKKNYYTKKRTFFPQSPTLLCINFFSKKNVYLLEWDVNECLSYQEKPGSWISFNPNNARHSSYLSFDLLF